MKIYKITKLEDEMSIYIGQTTLTLKERMDRHLYDQKYTPNRKVYQWLDKTCIIELIEEFETENEKLDSIKELQYVKEYESKGFYVLNKNTGKFILNKNSYIKEMSLKHNKNLNDKFNKLKNKDYNNWAGKLAYKAKKEGLTRKEYQLKYSIPDYDKNKKI